MRYPDWQARFWRAIKAQHHEPFSWGKRDCVLSAAIVADSISDVPYLEMAKDRFHWTNAREAVVLLNGASLESLVAEVMGAMTRWQSLSMGDVAFIVDDEERESLGVHDGTQVIGPDAIGWKSIPFRCVKGGWMVT